SSPRWAPPWPSPRTTSARSSATPRGCCSWPTENCSSPARPLSSSRRSAATRATSRRLWSASCTNTGTEHTRVRWLLIKDLQILRRSPLLVGLLIVYPIAIALMIGFALSSPPSKPTVAFYNQVPKGHGTISLGSQKIDVGSYARDLLRSVQPIKVHSEAEAVAAVRDGRALAAVVVPADLTQQIQSLVTQ